MIHKNDCMLLGTLIKPQGIRGALLLGFRDLKAEEFKKRETVFVEIDGLLVPFFVEGYQVRSGNTAVLKFEGIDTETDARELAGKWVYVLKSQVTQKGRTREQSSPVTGYRVEDLRLGFVGLAGKMTGNTRNPLLQVFYEGREFLVPVHEDIIRDIDDHRQLIRIEAPEGLFDL